MSLENPHEENELERKRQEFFNRVDAGDFDDVIRAHDIQEQDKLWEMIGRLDNPTTPDELIDFVTREKATQQIGEEMAIEEITGEYERKKDERDKQSRDIIADLTKKMVEGGGRIGLLRREFKENLRNLEKYMRGEL